MKKKPDFFNFSCFGKHEKNLEIVPRKCEKRTFSSQCDKEALSLKNKKTRRKQTGYSKAKDLLSKGICSRESFKSQGRVKIDC